MGLSKLRVLVIATALAGAACEARSLATPGSAKPGAPVEVELRSRDLGNQLVEVTLAATPTVDVDGLTLHLAGQRRQLAGRRAGQREELRLVVRAPGEVIGGADTVVGSRRRSRAAVLAVGAQKPTPVQAYRVVTLPGGEKVAEVKP